MKIRHTEDTARRRQRKPRNNVKDKLSDDTKEKIEEKDESDDTKEEIEEKDESGDIEEETEDKDESDDTKGEIEEKDESGDIEEETEDKNESDDTEEETEEKDESDNTEEEIEEKEEAPKKNFKYYFNRFRYYHYYYSEIIQDYITVVFMWIFKIQLYLIGIPMDKLFPSNTFEEDSLD